MAWQDFLRNNSQGLTQAGVGLLSGQSPQEQVALGAQGWMQGAQANKTKQWVMQNAPKEIAQAVEMGVISPSYAFKTMMESRTKKAPIQVNGRLLDPDTYQVLADFSEKKAPESTALMRELEAAGLQPGSPEYQQAILAANKPKGMTIESDGQGGFRMVQGADAGLTPALTVDQGKNTGFFMRAANSEKEIRNLETEGRSLYNKTMGALPGGLGNFGLSDDAQRFDQARRDFVNAILRRESGAVISQDEFDNANKQYFPQPGDSDAVIEQKRRNRETAIKGLQVGAGPGAAMQQRPALTGNRTSSGVTWSVE